MVAIREAIEVEALVTDRYLESLLAARDGTSVGTAAFGWADGDLDRGVRAASLRLRRDLPRFHPSFRFEERLALRLAEAAAAMHVARAAGAEGEPVPIGRRATASGTHDALLVPAGAIDEPGLRRHARPFLIGGAVASAAISLACAAFVAWRRSHPGGSAMARAVRAAHAARQSGAVRPAGEAD